MGYKYGLWMVYDKADFPTTHIGHVTITCYMEKDDATQLYHELLHVCGKYHEIYIECTNPIKFDQNMYENDDNNLYSWGYEGRMLHGLNTNLWSNIEKIAQKYKCNFSYKIHTSMYYSLENNALIMHKMNENKIVKCTIELVDITSNEPTDWHIIST